MATDDRQRFYALAKWAIAQGLVTAHKCDVIARPRTRKGAYWGRHYYDLRCVVMQRLNKTNGEEDEVVAR